MTRILLYICCFVLTGILHAQEIEVPLVKNSDQYELSRQRKNIVSTRSVATLPFKEDFSKDNFPGNPDGNPVLWENTAAYLNETFPVNPPTIGVITFDGLDEIGYPYDFDCPNC